MNYISLKKNVLGWSFIICLLIIPQNILSQKVLTLEEAMNVALKNSPEIVKSELNMTISQENLKAREAATKSNFSFQVAPFYYNQNRTYDNLNAIWNTSETKKSYGDLIISQPIVLTDARISLRNHLEYQDAYSEFGDKRTKGYSNNLYLQISQPVFTYNKLKMELDRLRLALENATLNYSIQRLYLERQVTQFFYSVYQKQMALKISEDDYKNQKNSYEIIKSKVEGGLSANAELLQAELNFSTSKSDLQNKKVDLDNAKDDFRQYIGLPLNEDFEIQTNVEFTLIPVDLPKAIKSGLDSRMELKQREINMKNSRNDLIIAKATNEFNGNVDLSVGLFGENRDLPNVYDKPTRSPSVLLTFTIPIFDWGERKSRIKASEANIKIEEINIANEKTNIELAIRRSYRSLQNLNLQVEIGKQSEKNAQMTYDINLERYKNGDLTSMDLGRYQTQLSQAKMNLANSLIAYKLELLNMKIQSLWDFENNSTFIPKNLQDNIKKEDKK